LIQKIKVGAVSYLNTKPLIYGFEYGMMKDEVELIVDYPSNIAQFLQEDKIDIGLIPVAVIPTLKEYFIVSDYCIACDGEVASVCLFSDVPIDKIEKILLDYQSKTSVALLKILLQEFWHINPEIIVGSAGYEDDIKGTTAGLVIGDRAFKQRLVSPYIYDLGNCWKEMTSLPFVFAAWVCNKPMEKLFTQKFNAANKAGFDNLKAVIDANTSAFYDLGKYYTVNIKYNFLENYHVALNTFLEKISLLK
jgi:chorismate dehydratase